MAGVVQHVEQRTRYTYLLRRLSAAEAESLGAVFRQIASLK